MLVNNSVDKTQATRHITASGQSSAAVNSSSSATKASLNNNQAASSKQSKQITVLARWGVAADISKQIARQDQAENSIKQVYSSLDGLKRQLQGPVNGPLTQSQQQQVQRQLTQLNKQMKKASSELDEQLQPKNSSGAEKITRYLTSKIDLLSERRQPENIQILLGRTGNAVSLHLPAEQDADLNLQTIKQAFSSQQIDVNTDAQQHLYFSAENQNRRKLQEPWLMSGEGVRVAAGNPVSVNLQEPESALVELAAQADRVASIQEYQHQVQQIQQRLKLSLKQVQAQRQELQAQLARIQQFNNSENSDELEQISNNLRLGMQAGSATAISVVVAQANVTRNMVSFGLS